MCTALRGLLSQVPSSRIEEEEEENTDTINVIRLLPQDIA